MPSEVYSLFALYSTFSIPGVPEKAERSIFNTLRMKFATYYKFAYERTFSPEKNDTKIVKFGSVILILWQFHESLSFSTFRPFSRVNVP